ncbi:MmcQ/YjbR family DNA-binding protein [Pseudonocardia broussonetiae]|uniref:MmcQ/YjbR family DNA-binding protein n=1 Tax=Pseudonocardia broussonetiae TaxID=2736640 RepID=A0A6M6JFT7_9PSEU|nr:MmcQ/YjbR family DNA-binding protein [Pseudonocardia broussonetiae]QJY45341.1 MmcQ/YjbR family DNA-binding protein [Pseudonocardia broussonetiae]
MDGNGRGARVADLRPLGAGLERSYEVHVRGRLEFRVGQIVYVAISLDETVLGFAFPKEEREALVAGDPNRFHLPSTSDLRFNRVHATLAALDPVEARELVVDAWRLVVPKTLSRAYDLAHPEGPGARTG